MVFFLLSGFVIYANEHDRIEHDLGGYISRRFFRIYPGLVFAMVVTVVIAAHMGTLAERFLWRDAACTLLALQDASALKPGTICGPFLDNSPLWSLSYELVFYGLFPLVMTSFRGEPQRTHHAVGVGSALCAVAYIAMPSHFLLLPSYFVIWWLGAALAASAAEGHLRISKVIWPLTYVFLSAGIWLGAVVLDGGIDQFGTYPFLMARHFVVAGALGVIVLTPAAHVLVRMAGVVPAAVWAWLASISYGVYVLHNPLLVHWDIARSAWGFVFSFALLIVLAWVCDARTNIVIRRWRKRPLARSMT